MTNFEWLKSLPVDEFAREWCYRLELAAMKTDEHQCDICPWSGRCKPGNNGCEEWLREEHK